MSAPPARMLRALILDFDHTLVDFGRWVDWQGARDELVALYDGAGVPLASIDRRAYAFGLFSAFDEALAARTSRARADAVRADVLAILERYERAGAGRTGWLPGAEAVLEAARSHGLELAIVSANAEAPIRAVLDRLGAGDRFASVVGRSPEFAPKPAPAMHRETLRRLGVPADTALGVGDSPNDMRAAVAADILTVGVLGGEGKEARLFESGAAWVLADLTALPALLALWGAAV